MSDTKIPDRETRIRHLSRMRELNKKMDKHIIDLDELNAQLEEKLREQRRGFLNGTKTQQIVTDSSK